MANIGARISIAPTEVNDIAGNRGIALFCRCQYRANPQRITSIQRALPCRALKIEYGISHPELNTFTSTSRGCNTIAWHIRCPKQPVHKKLTPFTTCIVKVRGIRSSDFRGVNVATPLNVSAMHSRRGNAGDETCTNVRIVTFIS